MMTSCLWIIASPPCCRPRASLEPRLERDDGQAAENEEDEARRDDGRVKRPALPPRRRVVADHHQEAAHPVEDAEDQEEEVKGLPGRRREPRGDLFVGHHAIAAVEHREMDQQENDQDEPGEALEEPRRRAAGPKGALVSHLLISSSGQCIMWESIFSPPYARTASVSTKAAQKTFRC